MSGAVGRLTSSGVDGALLRYRVMSFVVGVMLLVLCVVALPLQYVWNRPALASAGFPLHGFLYIIYLLTVADLDEALSRRAIGRDPRLGSLGGEAEALSQVGKRERVTMPSPPVPTGEKLIVVLDPGLS